MSKGKKHLLSCYENDEPPAAGSRATFINNRIIISIVSSWTLNNA